MTRDLQRKLNGEMRSAEAKMRKMDDELRNVHARFHRGSPLAPNGEVVDWRTPLDELMEREEEADQAVAKDVIDTLQSRLPAGDELPEPLQKMIHEAARDEYAQCQAAFLEWLFAAGPHPLEVMRRLFAYTKVYRSSLLWNMGFRQLGTLLDESHGAMHYRCQVLFSEVPAGWKKPASSIPKMREAQKGNQNRRGHKGIKTKLKK